MDEFEELKKTIQEAYDSLLANDETDNFPSVPFDFTEDEIDIEEEELFEEAEPFQWSPDFFDQIDS
ncbi:MAG: hypothetical protein Q4C52_05145 [Eubacteriales bacterium]|nr:hypothetical protein [Eubacteriales bacterium]